MSSLTPVPTRRRAGARRRSPSPSSTSASTSPCCGGTGSSPPSAARCGLAGAGIHYAITPKAYQATTIIQIERRNLTPLSTSQNPWLENYWNMEFYPTQYELLQSRGLAERVVKSLDLMEDPAFNPGAASREAGSGRASADRRGRRRGARPARRSASGAASRSSRCAPPSWCSSPSAPPPPSSPPGPPTPSPRRTSTWGSRTATPPPARPPPSSSSQIEKLKQEIRTSESQLQAFSRRSDIVSLDPGANVTLKRLEALNGQYIEAKKLRIEREAQYHETLNGPRGSMADSLSTGVVERAAQPDPRSSSGSTRTSSRPTSPSSPTWWRSRPRSRRPAST